MNEAAEVVVWLVFPAGTLAGAALAAGVAFTRERLSGRRLRHLLAGVGVVGLLAVLVGVLGRDEYAEAGHALGWLLVALLMVVFGLAVWFAIGWLTGRIRGDAGLIATVVAWLLLLAPASAGVFCVLVAIAIADCPPNAHECPF